MYSRWTQNLKNEDAKERFKSTVLSAKPALERLLEIIDEDELALNRSEADTKSFDLPNWDYRQAFKNGQRNVYSAIKKYIDLDQQEIRWPTIYSTQATSL